MISYWLCYLASTLSNMFLSYAPRPIQQSIALTTGPLWSHPINNIKLLPCWTTICRAGDHVTFVYNKIVSQQMFFAIFFNWPFKILLIYIDHAPGNQIPIPAVKNFPILRLYFSIYACTKSSAHFLPILACCQFF